MMAAKAERFSRQWLGIISNGAIALGALFGVVLMQQTRLDQASLKKLNPEQAEQQEALQIELMKRSPLVRL
jgi:hypothetical protein